MHCLHPRSCLTISRRRHPRESKLLGLPVGVLVRRVSGRIVATVPDESCVTARRGGQGAFLKSFVVDSIDTNLGLIQDIEPVVEGAAEN